MDASSLKRAYHQAPRTSKPYMKLLNPQVRLVLGIAQCCFDSIDNFVTMTGPLRELIKKDSQSRRGEYNQCHPYHALSKSDNHIRLPR